MRKCSNRTSSLSLPLFLTVMAYYFTNDRIKSSQGISIPYSYQAGLVPGLSMEQGIRQAYPFIVPGQYVTPMQYQQQVIKEFVWCT